MARFVCPICRYTYDEDIEGAPFDPATFVCPLCGCDGSSFQEEPSGDSTAAAEAEAEAQLASINYPKDTARQDASIRHMDTIHTMAISGHSIGEAMATRLPLPSWDDILVLGAQLNPMPLDAGAVVDTTVVIGPKAEKPLVLENPLLVSHMSFGALSREAKHALALGAAAAKAGNCGGEGGVLPEEMEAAHRYIFEYIPNKYSLTDENLQNSDAIEIKMGQGTKPGMGGHLPGDKVTVDIASFRGVHPGTDVQSPSRFPGINTKDDLKALVDELRKRSLGRPIGIKIAAGHIEDDLAFIVYAGADYVTIDGRGGATGSSPKLLRDATSVPTIYALARTRAYLDEHAPDMSLIITGGLRVSSDFIKAFALGADAVAIASSSLMAIGCQQYRVCGSGKCPVGIATQDPELRARFDVKAGAARLANFLNASNDELQMFCRIAGHEHLSDFSKDDLITLDHDIAAQTGITFA